MIHERIWSIDEKERFIRLLDSYLTDMGHRPACPTICIPKMIRDSKSGVSVFPFYVNPHNLAWYADEDWREYGDNGKALGKSRLDITFRDLTLHEIGI